MCYTIHAVPLFISQRHRPGTRQALCLWVRSVSNELEPMNKTIPLSEIFHVSSRFRRSVHLERDFYAENSLDGYVVTITARETLRRLISALENPSASKAWSLTGPYGSGKSAFALFAAKLLGNPESPATQQALNLLERGDVFLWDQFVGVRASRQKERGFCPVLISGERAPITTALLRGLADGLTAFSDCSQFAPLIKAIERRLGSATPESPPYASEITGFFETATHQIGEIGGAGLILVVDELGKFLEYAAQHPSQGDMFLLQSLAEFAARSGDTPLFLLTILHQAFEQYAQRLGKSQREEWAKVQGRFEDVSFMEPTEQVLRLIGDAIERDASAIQTLDNARRFRGVSVDLELKPRQLDTTEFLQLLKNCLPLHPAVALIVGPLFRRFAQNERSLFALLNSGEPHGLQDFLANHSYDEGRLPFFSLPNLYDYINTAFGNRLYGSSDGKKWAGIESAIARLPNPSPLMVALIKTVGLLGVVGEVSVNLKSSTDLLRYALDDGTENYSQDFESALSELEKRSIAIYRRHNDAYALWEGSDIDIESRLSEATAQLDSNQRLATTISEVLPPQPLIARRHLFKTGTLRYFVIQYTDVKRFDADLEEPLGDADGLVLYALPASEFEAETLVKKTTEPSVADRKEVLIANPQSIDLLQDAVVELARLRWVEDHTPELDGDATARRELAARTAEAERTVFDQLSSLFGATIAGQDEGKCTWYHAGNTVQITSRRELNAHLSRICDSVYHKAPIIRNELINQRQLSHSAARARRMLIKAMLECGVQENLDITGYPPERSVYLSLLSDTGIHRNVSGEWGFHPPQRSYTNKMWLTWEAIEAFLDDCEVERQPVSKLYRRLEEPPIGLRSGPIPILLCAVLLHYEAEIALYEDGSFVTDITIAVFERLIRSPEKFGLKRFRMSGIRSEVFSQFLTLISKPSPETGQPNLLAVVKPLVRFVTKLPRYTMLTQELTHEAIELRKTIGNAREPDTLLFVQLPQALGFDAFGPYEEMNPTTVGRFFNTLRRVLTELNRAYDELLASVAQLLSSAFSLKGNNEEIRLELYRRAESLLDLTIETKLKGFFLRVCDEELDFKGWLEAIGTYIVQKPPSAWNDSDNTQFQMNLAELGKKFHHFEAVSFERRKQSQEFSDSAGEVMRVGVTTLKTEEKARVIALPPTAETQAKAIEREIEQIFEFAGVAEDTELRLAVLARLSRKLMEQLEN